MIIIKGDKKKIERKASIMRN